MAQLTLSQEKNREAEQITVWHYVRVLTVGMAFGIILIKSDVANWRRIHEMFRFMDAYMYLLLATAVTVGATSMWIIKKLEMKTVEQQPIVYKPKPYHKGVIFGGFIFGLGWAVTGACPGPIYAQIGAGEWIALLTWIGAFAGMYLYGYLQPRLPH